MVLRLLIATVGQCHFEDSNGDCWRPTPRGVCRRPQGRHSAAFVQHADSAQLCSYDPPYGFRPMCSGKGANEALHMLRTLRDPATCYYRTCALVGASGTLLGARLGAEIDRKDAVIRVNFAPDGPMAAQSKHSPHSHKPTWIADVGERTTWRVITMEGYGYLNHYPRFWLRPPKGHGDHVDMSSIPQRPLLAVSCHTPSHTMGRCRIERLRQVFAHPWSASYLINPGLKQEHFRGVRNQKTLSTGMTAVAFARQLCGEVHLYGFGNGSCGDVCYHYYDCGPTAGKAGQATQATFLTSAAASGGFHNFSAQANALRRMAVAGQIIPHWGRCDRNLGDPPAGHLTTESQAPTVSGAGYSWSGRGGSTPTTGMRSRRRRRRRGRAALRT